ncbi:plasmid mobilization relaxosome protein MobC, partial [Escherichia coli]|nr:plasmid mobilization relaxosome protein MobC [Escherichia coli]
MFGGVMIPINRERMLTMRFTDDDHAGLRDRCEGKHRGVWRGGFCGGGRVPLPG